MSERRPVTLCGRRLDLPGHICAFFDSREEQYDTLVPYYGEGLAEGERVVTIVDADEVRSHRAQLQARGIDVEGATAAERLKVLTAEETYVAGGRFAAQRMYDVLQGALADAHARGMAVRTSGVMDWATRGHAGTEELMEYEARVNVLVPIYQCTLLCVYDLSRIDGRTVMDVLTTHPYVIYRRAILQNPHYRPPIERLQEMLLGHARPVGQRVVAG